MEEERCPGCRGLIIDGVCPHCTSPIPGLSPPASEPTEPAAAPPEALAVHITMNVLAWILGVYWVGMGIWLLVASVNSGPGGAGMFGAAFAVLCVVLGLYGARAAWSMLRRSYSAQGRVALAAFAGIGWAVLLSLFFEYWVFSLIIPLHLVVGVFAVVGARHFERAFY